MKTLERAKEFLRRHMWARIVATVLLVGLMPLWILCFVIAVASLGPYQTVYRWANNIKREDYPGL